MTRDGIEVVAVISITFRIDAREGEGGTLFGFNEENTRRAITEALTQDANPNAPVWSQLPAKMAADVWREYLRRFKLSELFEVPDQQEDNTKLQLISLLVKERLAKPNVRELDDFGQPIRKVDAKGKPVWDASGKPEFREAPSREFSKLQEMGYKVFSVNIKKLIFSPEIEERLIQQWSSMWLKNAQKEREQVERARKLSEMKGTEKALKDFAKNASSEISQVQPRNRAAALYMLIEATRKSIIKNNTLTRKMNTEPTDLREISTWLRDKAEGNDDSNG
jgi:regulator of protease activity HflC (stomatin/prohibitin superfamily)